MMIASRFRTVVWVAGVAIAALGCYLVSLKVAAERAQVMRIDRQLSATQGELRELGTELDTRGRLVQLERWNADVLALTAPKAAQYLTGEMQLASLATQPAADTGGAETPAARALQAPAEVARVAYAPPPRPASRLLHSVSLDLDSGSDAKPALRPAALVRVAYLDGKTLRP